MMSIKFLFLSFLLSHHTVSCFSDITLRGKSAPILLLGTHKKAGRRKKGSKGSRRANLMATGLFLTHMNISDVEQIKARKEKGSKRIFPDDGRWMDLSSRRGKRDIHQNIVMPSSSSGTTPVGQFASESY